VAGTDALVWSGIAANFATANHITYYARNVKKAYSYVQPSGFDMLAGANPVSAIDGWAE